MSIPVTEMDTPVGISLVQTCCPTLILNKRSSIWSKILVIILTFVIYTCYHATRKPMSIVKGVLHQNCSSLVPPSSVSANDTTWCDWKPFDRDDANSLFGILDSCFLFAYAFGMYGSGFIAERVNLRYFLSIGMIMSGICCYLLGLARVYDVHSLWYFVIIQISGGIFQTTGWPGVVTVMGHWFGEGKTGILFGVWNSHTSIGNILGNFIAGYYVKYDWSRSFIVPGAIMIVVGLVVFFFLQTSPTDTSEEHHSQIHWKFSPIPHYDIEHYRDLAECCIEDNENTNQDEDKPILVSRNEDFSKAIGFKDALKIPGVVEFSLCLFFAKLVSYTFLYWLPLYIIDSTRRGATFSADLSSTFDVGGAFGGIIAGTISDLTGMSAFACAIMLLLSIPTMYTYYLFGSVGLTMSIVLLFVTGALVNGPYALITTAVSAKLGMCPSVGRNKKALAMVTSIIDGTGSVGAAIGPLLAGFVSTYFDWKSVFYMLMISDVIALAILTMLVRSEIEQFSRTSS